MSEQKEIRALEDRLQNQYNQIVILEKRISEAIKMLAWESRPDALVCGADQRMREMIAKLRGET